jgi:hypothetical protein
MPTFHLRDSLIIYRISIHVILSYNFEYDMYSVIIQVTKQLEHASIYSPSTCHPINMEIRPKQPTSNCWKFCQDLG